VSGQPTARRRTGRSRRTGRRGGDSGTREAILAAARARFGDAGYDRATIRGIAADAGVDPALVHHYFGTKERLFAAAMRLPVAPGEVLAPVMAPGAGAPGSVGEHVLRTALGLWEVPEMRSAFLGLLRTAATSEDSVAMLREFVTETILGRIAQAAAHDGRVSRTEAEYRAALVGSQVLGLALTRYVFQLAPLLHARDEELIAAIGPTLDRYLTGQIGPETS
jgi:AcrR family transcriptional regulator